MSKQVFCGLFSHSMWDPEMNEISQVKSGASQVALVVKNPLANAGDIRDTGSVPGSGRSPGGGHGNPLHYSCLEDPMDRGVWRATVRRVSKSWTKLKPLSMQNFANIMSEMNRL